MKKFIEARIYLDRKEDADIAVARLADMGFEGFVEQEDQLLAYREHGPSYGNAREELNAAGYTDAEVRVLDDRNWNEEWESSYQPVTIPGQLVIRAPFHEQPAKGGYDIIIEPKMSFGTAHHETTLMMLEYILDIDLEGSSVLDMGCGTGVLAILAEKKGAREVMAVDIDEWAYNNALENCKQNQTGILVKKGDVSLIHDLQFDIIFANINRNILLEDIPKYSAALADDGLLLMSGFYTGDLAQITGQCRAAGLQFLSSKEENNWVAALYKK